MERSDAFRELLKRFGVNNGKKGEPERKSKRDCRQPVIYSPSASESSVRRSTRKKIPAQKLTANPPVVRLPVSKPSDNKSKVNVERRTGKAADRSREQGGGKKPDSIGRFNSPNVSKKRKPAVEEPSSKRLKRSLNPDLNPQNTSTPRVQRTVSVNLSSRFPSDENDSSYRSASLRTRAENDERPQASLLLEHDPNRLNRRWDDDFVVPAPPPRGRKENYYDNRDVPFEPQQFDIYDATRRPTAGQPRDCRQTELYSPSVHRSSAVKKTNAPPVSKPSDNKSKDKGERKRKAGDRSRERGDGKKQDSVDRSSSLNASKKRKPTVEETSNKRLKRSQNQDMNRQNSPKNKRTVSVNLSSRFPADKNDSSYFSSSFRSRAEDEERPQPSLLLGQQSNRLNRQRDDDVVVPALPPRASAFSQVPPHVRRDNYFENRDYYESRQFDRYAAPRRPVGQSLIDLDYQPAQLDDSIGPSASQLPDPPVRRYNYDIPWSRQQQLHIKQPYVRLQDFNRSRTIRNHDEERSIRRPVAFPTTRDADGFLRPANPLPLQPPQQSSSEDHFVSSSLASLMETVEEVINEDAPALDIAFCLKEAERTLVIWNSKMIENLQLYDSARESLVNAPRYAQSSNEQAVLNWVFNDERPRLQMMSNYN